MGGDRTGRTFISYSRKDGAEFAACLRKWLGQRNLSVWQDIVALEGGRDWWSQIEDVLKSKALQHFILVVTPADSSARVACLIQFPNFLPGSYVAFGSARTSCAESRAAMATISGFAGAPRKARASSSPTGAAERSCGRAIRAS